MPAFLSRLLSNKFGRLALSLASTLFLVGCTAIGNFNGDTLGSSTEFSTWSCGLANEVLLYSIGGVIVLLVIAIIIFALGQYGGPVFQMFGAQPPSQQLVASIAKGTLAFMLLPALISVIVGVLGNSTACTIGG